MRSSEPLNNEEIEPTKTAIIVPVAISVSKGAKTATVKIITLLTLEKAFFSFFQFTACHVPTIKTTAQEGSGVLEVYLERSTNKTAEIASPVKKAIAVRLKRLTGFVGKKAPQRGETRILNIPERVMFDFVPFSRI